MKKFHLTNHVSSFEILINALYFHYILYRGKYIYTLILACLYGFLFE